ncbi:hypothetical protein [Vibrio phage vB_VmeM-Yong XC32]|nr:hypothetical protein [Vibrio phage vB_VmeM-Yong XC31]QAX96409.1 hypothetical protein [Vibrio phage vB_VmeM-Yong XC32]QAX96726.1 hypothetical protein [Vibrio phage vB_VmeM-Yong MS31]QAX97045.1 hypothetical protein [Vibrio phage vB_VmeM-Yong MS32]
MIEYFIEYWYFVLAACAISIGLYRLRLGAMKARDRYKLLVEKTLNELRSDVLDVLRKAKMEGLDFKEARSRVYLYMSQDVAYKKSGFINRFNSFDLWLENRWNEDI